MKKIVLAVAALALVTTAAFADIIADRKAVMKENAKDVGVLVKMVAKLPSMRQPSWRR